jgi:membrane associated rhomboid family serine protease
MQEFRPGRFEILPPIVKNLIIINVLMAFLQFVMLKFGIVLTDLFGLHYWKSPLYRPWQLLTHMFMHGSPYDVNLTISHLFFNMLGLWMFGSVLENIWGSKRFLMFYLICGFGAAACHLAVLGYEFSSLELAFHNYQQTAALDTYLKFIQEQGLNKYPAFNELKAFWVANPACSNCVNHSIDLINEYYRQSINEVTVGASGAIFGVLFAFGYLFPNTLLYVYFLVPVKAKYLVAALALFDLFSGIKNSAGDNVAHFAHLGGMVVAFIVLKIWNKNNRRTFY